MSNQYPIPFPKQTRIVLTHDQLLQLPTRQVICLLSPGVGFVNEIIKAWFYTKIVVPYTGIDPVTSDFGLTNQSGSLFAPYASNDTTISNGVAHVTRMFTTVATNVYRFPSIGVHGAGAWQSMGGPQDSGSPQALENQPVVFLMDNSVNLGGGSPLNFGILSLIYTVERIIEP